MRYLVLGCGAIGGTIAAGLARDGHDVLACDANPEVVEAIRARGLTVTGPVEDFTVRLPAITPDELPERIDYPVLLAVKAHHTRTAASLVAGRLRDDAFVVSLQNGLNARVLSEILGAGRVVECCVNFGADAIAPGIVARGNRATFVVGELDGPITDRVRALAADIADAQATGSVLGYLWAKEAYGALLAATAVSDLPIAEVFEDARYRPLLLALARQVLTQAPVRPEALDGFDADDLEGSLARLATFNRRSAKTHTGIYRDLAITHRPTEVGAILGGFSGPLIRHVVDITEAIEQGRRTCSRANLDLLAAYERMYRLGAPLNAIATVISAPDRPASGPLAGRAVAVKDIIDVAGVPTRCGSPASDTTAAGTDAVIASRLRAAGADLFVKSQCLEYAAGFAHPEIGDTRNPRDPARTSGGSSGGSAALVAAGVCDLALGSDTGGSIRIPAAYCGVVGFKPTYGLLPVEGMMPLAPACDHAGTLTASVAGARDLVAAVTGRQMPATTRAPSARAPSARVPADRQARYTIGLLTREMTDPSTTAEVAGAIGSAIAELAAAGWTIRELTPEWADQLAEWEQTLAEIVARQAYLVHRDRDDSRYCDGTRTLLAFGAQVDEARLSRALARQHALASAIDQSLSGVDALAGPTVGFTAPEQDPPFGVGDDNAESRFTGPYNLSGHPAIALPVPASGLPVSLQFAGRRGADADLLAVAESAQDVLATCPDPAPGPYPPLS